MKCKFICRNQQVKVSKSDRIMYRPAQLCNRSVFSTKYNYYIYIYTHTQFINTLCLVEYYWSSNRRLWSNREQYHKMMVKGKIKATNQQTLEYCNNFRNRSRKTSSQTRFYNEISTKNNTTAFLITLILEKVCQETRTI